jgi:putative transcriptional regulator
MSEKDTTVRVVKRDGQLYREEPDGTETLLPVPPIAHALADDEIVAAALSDPDNPPSSTPGAARWRRLPRTFGIRRRLGLTREEFATRFQIPIGTVNDWEDGRSAPDPAAETFLRLIALDPDRVAQMLIAPQAAE